MPAPVATAPAPRSAREDGLAPLLAHAVGQRAAPTPAAAPGVLQRAVIALNGPSDGPAARKITLNCLDNLTRTRDRGATAGPGDVGSIDEPDLDENESLYILGHGNTAEIAELTPSQLGDTLIRWYGATRYSGKIKLVACSSAVSPDPISGASSYAEGLRDHIAANTTWRFHPSAVDGVLGVAWVDETSGRILMIDDPEYDRQEALGTDVEGAFAKKTASKRQARLESIFGVADQAGSSVHTGKGTAKVRFYLPERSFGASVLGALSWLVPCIP